VYGALYIIVCMCGAGRGDMSECGLKVYFFLSVHIIILVPKSLLKRLWTCCRTVWWWL